MTFFFRQVEPCQAPTGSAIEPLIEGADFWDAYGITLEHSEQTALAMFQQGLAATPAWVEQLMALRNAVVRRLGLKALGGLSAVPMNRGAQVVRPGDRVGPFTLLSHTADEVLVHDDDKHLRVAISLHRVRNPDGLTDAWVLTTVVHLHNLLGRLYMLPVTPLHKLIAPAVLARFEALGASA